jgi:Flp pilus assembly protein protease CpaA
MVANIDILKMVAVWFTTFNCEDLSLRRIPNNDFVEVSLKFFFTKDL